MKIALLLLLALASVGLPMPLVRAEYLYEVCHSQQIDASPSNFRITRIEKPNRMRLEWDYAPMGGASPPVLVLERRLVGGAWSELARGDIRLYDDTSFGWAQNFEYRVFIGYDNNCLGLPSPPPNPPPDSVHYGSYVSNGTPVIISATPVEVTAAENQAIDSRWDLRYGNPTHLDFNFGSRIYRGGLFAGYAEDPSRVGRSLLKFNFSGIPANSHIWTYP